ncbi:MAG: hypothetical protein M5T61_05305 [Acidimicrobiia bacterium]|nr:hypothetical protein [Acidimicrobiia bacterium]
MPRCNTGSPINPTATGRRRTASTGVAAGLFCVFAIMLAAPAASAADEMPCDFLPIGVEGATLDRQGPDSYAECIADLLVGERTAAGDSFVGVFLVTITHESWGSIEDLYRSVSDGGTPTDLGDEGVLKTFPAVATDAYGAYFLKGPYYVSVEHTVMDPDFFVEDTALTKALTEILARAIDTSMEAAGVGASAGDSGVGIAPSTGGRHRVCGRLRRRHARRPDRGDDCRGPRRRGGHHQRAASAPEAAPRPARRRDAHPLLGEVAAIDEAADRLDRELDELRRARDAARDRIERIGARSTPSGPSPTASRATPTR